MDSRFRELWNESYNMLSFEIKRLNMDLSYIDKQIVFNYYKERIIDGLWYSRTFVSDYNSWLWEHVEDGKKRNKIRDIMYSFNPPSNSLLSAWSSIFIGIIAIIAGIWLLSISQEVAGVPTLLIGVTLLAMGFFMFRKSKGKTNLEAIKIELNNIGDKIEKML